MKQHEPRTRRFASSFVLVSGMLLADPETASASSNTTGEAMPIAGVAPPPSALPSRIEPTQDAHATEGESSDGLPRSLVYGAMAGLFLLVAAAVGAHHKH